jgi:signal transduction histidine kinase
MRKLPAEWLLLPLFLLPLIPFWLGLEARSDYIETIENARRDGERVLREQLEQAPGGEDFWRGQLTGSYVFSSGIPFEIPDSAPLGSFLHRNGMFAAPREIFEHPWVCGDRRPVGLDPSALADSEVRLSVETGTAPIAQSGLDDATRQFADLLRGEPDLPRLRDVPLPAATKHFILRRWLKGRPDDPLLVAATGILADLARFEAWWAGLADRSGPGFYRHGAMRVLVDDRVNRIAVFPDDFCKPPPMRFRWPAERTGIFRVEYLIGAEYTWGAEADEKTLWEGRLEEPLAGHWRLSAIHGDDWWNAPGHEWMFWYVAGLIVLYVILFSVLGSLRERRQQAEARSRFLTEVAHDLRTPLTSLRLHAEMLDTGRAPEKDRGEYVSTMARESARLSSLLANLLDLSRLDRGTRVFAPATVDVPDAVAAAVRDFLAVAPDRKDDVSTSGPDGVRARADTTALARSLANLLENAGKFTARGTPIRVTWAESGKFVRITVEDRGPGIPPALEPNLFTRYTRGHQAKQDGVPGTGLGLSLVGELIRGCGGQVLLLKTDVGATFVLQLERATDE